ncbi:MAG: two-component system response regulator GlrR, partial [Syntrophobacterales bacterium CG23_combo_of_CG06-09_8_20_14_all_48_27]
MITLPKILVVDDDRNLLELLKMRLESANYTVVTTEDGNGAVEAVKKQIFDLAIIDLQLPNQSGTSIVNDLHLINPEMPVIILTAYGSIESAVDAVKKGAFNYLTKPFQPAELLSHIEKALEGRRLTSEIKQLKGLLEKSFDFSNLVAKSEKMQKILEEVSNIAKTESTVYIHGESGTGKELIARVIHLASERKDKPFVAINCAAIPETLLESELFGHEKGAFTGAVRSTKGLFAQAHEGTIFLDEIGNMPLLFQAKLLRVLQEQQFYPVGSERSLEVNVRVITATNKDLEVEVKKGTFREDLFYRIHVIPIHLSPLMERKEDIPYLTEYFIKKFGRQMKKEVKGITPGAMQKLMLHDWPGNVRELENTIEYAMVMSHQELITEDIILQTKDAPDKLHPL